MNSTPKFGWLVAACLLLLCFVPVAAGGIRIGHLILTDATPDFARIFAAPVPIVLHILATSFYAVVGALQFAPGIRDDLPDWHRNIGRVAIVAGGFTALSGLWMTQYYPWPKFDGEGLYISRLIVGVAMFYFVGLGAKAISRKDIRRHHEWMIRAYALAMAAGTQLFTHIPAVINPDLLNETTHLIMMDAGWVINIVIAETIIYRHKFPKGAKA